MLKSVFDSKMFMAAALLMLATVAAPGALAVTFNVNSTDDLPDTNPTSGNCHTSASTCTLRAAVMQANHSSGAGATIVVPAGTYNLIIPATIADGDDNGDLNLTTPAGGSPTPPITIIGAGAAATIIDVNQLDRVFHIHSGRTATISGLTIRNGYLAGSNDIGGGIYNQGSLTLSDVEITGNYIGAAGGGIYSNGTLTVMNSSISKNSSGFRAGGVFNAGSMTMINSTVGQNIAAAEAGGIFNLITLNVRNSTISGNSAGSDGGGILNDGSLFVVNSTLALNNANNNGGGIANLGGSTVNMYNTTIVFNGADADADPGGGAGGGVYNFDAGGAIFNMRNSLLAGNNIRNAPVYDECSGTVHSFGRNLVGADFACTVLVGTGSFTTLNSLATLGQLQNNGGPTSTVALLAGSNAIDGGDPALGCIDNIGGITTDQRGMPRVVGVRCDIGAYEFAPGGTTPTLQSAASRKVHGGAGTFDLALAATPLNPTTEPRQGPAQTIVFTFDKPISAAIATVTEGIATAGAPTFSGNNVVVDLTGVNNQQYVTITLTNVAAVDGGSGGSGGIRVGFLLGDANQNRVVTVADLGLVNAQLAQTVTAANYLKDVNASGTLTVADKGIANANLTKALPAP